MEILDYNEAANLIADLDVFDPKTDRQFIGAMEIHTGRHPQLGRISVIKENSNGAGVVFPAPRPMLTLAQVKERAA